VRVLIDYRPALRHRSGVGEYFHQLIKALMAAFPPKTRTPALEVTVFSSSWKDRLEPNDELAKRSKLLADRYNGQPKDLLYKIYVKYLPMRKAS